MQQWDEIIERIRDYNPDVNVDFLERVRRFVDEHDRPRGERDATSDRQEESGVPVDPAAIASILVDLRLDVSSIAAGMLVDCVRMRSAPLDVVEAELGEEVAFLLQGVTRLTALSPKEGASEQSDLQLEDFRRMILAMAQDIRVMLVRLALCLQQVRTAAEEPALCPNPRIMAREILDIYAPIAHRLGIHWLKSDLEDLSFRLSNPSGYRTLKRRIKSLRKGGADVVEKVIQILRIKMEENDIPGQVFGREKHLYSIHGKLKRKNTTLEELFDLIAYRIIVPDTNQCYRALGMIHSAFRPIPGRFKDYIALPKSNGYQSLHTVVFGPFGNRIEIQVRTEEMHQVAESGVAAHWVYKDKGTHPHLSPGVTGYAWLRQILSHFRNANGPGEFIENLRIDLFPDEIYLFTPQGNIITLPRGSTPVDFAYAVHSEVGDHCRGCKINDRMEPLNSTLNTGDTVEIITDKRQQPNPNWLTFVVTSKAKYRISRWVRKRQRKQAEALGRELVERELRKAGLGLRMSDKAIQRAVEAFHYADGMELFGRVGDASISALQAVHRMFPETLERLVRSSDRDALDRHTSIEELPARKRKESKRSKGGEPVRLGQAWEGVDVTCARCCSPLPGEPVVGIIVTGRGITVHRTTCPNLKSLVENQERWVQDISLPTSAGQNYLARLKVMAPDAGSVMAQVTQAVNDVTARTRMARTSKREKFAIRLDVEVTDRIHFDEVVQSIQSIPEIYGVRRMMG
ncbi:MAG: bifunctional (p)ppGpp synthetase/guanosine-3',5'-bis(diphosphate) 3'-pyrophosphohydrolase [Magnetococcales bacterium]|nr:bifunctional (p)ppGpp synthetase/guanosine-3',5'-bis(diphosphate) 3'-pyrophosphohydrolase [Magnetococcales bacterium]